MHRVIVGLSAVALLGAGLALAQNQTNPAIVGNTGAYNSSAPTCTNGNWCTMQTDVNGNLKVVNSGSPSGTQNVNITQVQGAAPSATNPLWVAPATANVPWAVSLPTTPTIAAGSGVVSSPSSEASAGVSTTSSSALAANTIIKGSAGNLYSFEVSADSTLSSAAWWIMIYNATSAPSDGAVTPAKCYAMSTGTTSFSAAFPTPIAMSTGITIGVSTTGCFTKTASTHAFISGDFK